MLSIKEINLLQAQNEGLKKQNAELQKEIAELKEEIKSLYEEKDCLHIIIDRLLENAGYSKDISSAEDFEEVYEDMQYKNNKSEEYKQTLQEIKKIAEGHTELCKKCEQQRKECDCSDICNAYRLEQILQKISEVE